MTGCVESGSTATIQSRTIPKRKYPCTLEFVQTTAGLVSVNTGRANTFVGEALAKEKITSLAGYTDIKAESKIPGGGGRFDFLARNAEQASAFIEVKSVTLYTGMEPVSFPMP